MPPAPVHKASPWAWLGLAIFGTAIAYWLVQHPYWAVLHGTVLGILVWIQYVWDRRTRRQLAASRQNEGICQFARSFERHTDTWVIRSVYEELSRYLTVDRRPIPIRRQDGWEKDLRVDSEDLDEIVNDMAFRARRSMLDCDKNPLYGKVQTVGDFVVFLQHQPRIVEPADPSNRGSETATRLRNAEGS